MNRKKVLIMGAAGRDFHNFNLIFRNDPSYEVVAFTATQIPNIEGRVYPYPLSGDLYPTGIPIYPENMLYQLIKEKSIDLVVFSYSDVSHEYVMNRASLALSAGADFILLGMAKTLVKAQKPVVSVCAIRTGSGKSQTSERISKIILENGLKPVVIRHPMPYGDLLKQRVQIFKSVEDMDVHNCTIEEREEYERHLFNNVPVLAGVDYEEITREAEKLGDVLIWDGGNNDLPFIKSDIYIVVVDPHRPGHEKKYHPGETNLRMADVVVINKIDSAKPENVKAVKDNIRELNPNAAIVEARSVFSADEPDKIKGKRVLLIEDGPTLTHGEMPYGVGYFAATHYGAKEIVDPRPYTVGSIKEAYLKYSHIGKLIPALGYSTTQIKELEETINNSDCDLVVIATPIKLGRVIKIKKPFVHISYKLQEISKPDLTDYLKKFGIIG